MLAAAERVFAQLGFHDASMDAIAAEAGISKPMLYNYFGSKQGIYMAYLGRAGQELLARLQAADPLDGSLAERLEAGARAFFGFVDEHRSGWRVLREEMVREGAAVGGQVASIRAGVTELMSELLASEGGIVAERVDAYAYALVGAGESLADWWLQSPGTPVDVLVETLTAMAGQLAGPDRKVP